MKHKTTHNLISWQILGVFHKEIQVSKQFVNLTYFMWRKNVALKPGPVHCCSNYSKKWYVLETAVIWINTVIFHGLSGCSSVCLLHGWADFNPEGTFVNVSQNKLNCFSPWGSAAQCRLFTCWTVSCCARDSKFKEYFKPFLPETIYSIDNHSIRLL